ncbi:MAG: hypothetical protein A2Y74_05350 [Actinobacteria bacterium RBG_13_63_9]|nr:MAG: hypothetical protein A2Y74_05350 [Actinobacteria bacterium RBG_13_63_9]
MADSNKPLFQTQRARVLGLYKENAQPFIASTMPYHSVRSLAFNIVDIDETNGLAFAVARRGQFMDFFGYGVGDRIQLGNVQNFQASEAETNLAKGKSTNGAADFIIEGIGMSCRAMLIQYSTGSGVITPAAPTDPDVVACMAGTLPIWDPASIVMVPQGQSPANLENGLFQALMPLLSLEFEWDRKRTAKLGVCDLLPQAGGASYLRANGVPSSDNRYEIPEGYVWRRDGEPDGEFVARVTLERALVVPISLRSLITTPTDFAAPLNLQIELLMRLYGLEVQLPSAN